MTKEDVFNILKLHANGNVEEKKFKKNFTELYQEIINISFPSDFKWIQKLYHFFHGDLELKLGICPTCGKRCRFLKFNKGYSHHCSLRCMYLDKNVKNKRKQTCLEKYGVGNYAQTQECQEKIKKTCKEKYGVEHNSQTKEYKEKYKQTCLDKYNTEYFLQSKECQEKSKQTCKEKYGVEHYSQTDECKKKVKETSLEKFGAANYSQTQECQERIKKTCKEKYGVEHYAKSNECHRRRKKRIQYDNNTFDSSWEVIVYQYCKENNIPCEYQPNIQFKYYYDGKEHIYQPDFLINNRLYEVKGNQFFEGNKMINPYDRNEDELYEAKHRCMLNNNVIILKEDDIKNLETTNI